MIVSNSHWDWYISDAHKTYSLLVCHRIFGKNNQSSFFEPSNGSAHHKTEIVRNISLENLANSLELELDFLPLSVIVNKINKYAP